MKVDIESSYKKNNLGKTIYKTVLRYKPKVIIDFGVLYGYSTVCMAAALKEIGQGHIIAFDLWDEYPYKHSSEKNTFENIEKYQLTQFVTLKKMDFFKWLNNPTHFDLIHIDISNDGDIIERAYNKLKYFLDKGSIIIFEGGTRKRDKEGWMKKYNKTPIFPLKKKIKYKIINYRWPGLSLIKK